MLGYFAGGLYWMWGLLAGACLALAFTFVWVDRWLASPSPAALPLGMSR